MGDQWQQLRRKKSLKIFILTWNHAKKVMQLLVAKTFLKSFENFYFNMEPLLYPTNSVRSLNKTWSVFR